MRRRVFSLLKNADAWSPGFGSGHAGASVVPTRGAAVPSVRLRCLRCVTPASEARSAVAGHGAPLRCRVRRVEDSGSGPSERFKYGTDANDDRRCAVDGRRARSTRRKVAMPPLLLLSRDAGHRDHGSRGRKACRGQPRGNRRRHSCHGALGKAFPERAPKGDGCERPADAGAQLLGQQSPTRELQWQQGFDTPAERLGEDGRTAIRRDGDNDWRAVDDRPELNVAMAGLVDDVRQRTCPARCQIEALRVT